MTAAPRVAFAGYYGMSNFGDDLFALLCAKAAQRFWNAEPRIIGPRLQESAVATTSRLSAERYGGGGLVGRSARAWSFLRGLNDCDVLALGGGSVINARTSFRTPLMLSAQRRQRVQLGAVGVSIGPFADASSQSAAARTARAFSYIAVRDRRSHELAQTMGLGDITHAGCDLAALLPLLVPSAIRRTHDAPRIIGVAPCRYAVRADHPAPSPDAWPIAFVNSIAAMARPPHVRVFCLNGHARHGDLDMAAKLHEALQARGIASSLYRHAAGAPLATVDAIADCDAFISARLHGAIVAYLRNVPFTIVDYHPKCRDFADDIGLDASLRIDDRAQDRKAFDAAIAAMLNARTPITGISPQIYALQAPGIFQCAPWSTPLSAPIHPQPAVVP